jgi:hypothetical protein
MIGIREKRRFTAYFDHGAKVKMVEWVTLIDITTRHGTSLDVVEGNQRHFSTADGDEAECITDGVYRFQSGWVARESTQS